MTRVPEGADISTVNERALVVVVLVPVRSALIRWTLEGGSGRVVWRVNERKNAPVVWPRLSDAWSVRVCGPSASAAPPLMVARSLAVRVKPAPFKSDRTSTRVPPSSDAWKLDTPLGSSTTPVIVGSEVMPSLLETPVSCASAAVMTGGLVSLAVVVIVCVSWLVLPATSLAMTRNACVPGARATLENVNAPVEFAWVFWIGVFGSDWRYRATKAPAPVVPARVTISRFVWVVWPVGLCEAAARPRVGMAGGVVRMLIETGAPQRSRFLPCPRRSP